MILPSYTDARLGLQETAMNRTTGQRAQGDTRRAKQEKYPAKNGRSRCKTPRTTKARCGRCHLVRNQGCGLRAGNCYPTPRGDYIVPLPRLQAYGESPKRGFSEDLPPPTARWLSGAIAGAQPSASRGRTPAPPASAGVQRATSRGLLACAEAHAGLARASGRGERIRPQTTAIVSTIVQWKRRAIRGRSGRPPRS